MVLRKYSAFLDDLQTITAVVPKKFDQRNIKFTLETLNWPKKVYNLTLESEFETMMDRVYRLNIPTEISLDTFFKVYDEERNATDLQYRNVVRTREFDSYFYYEGHDLGAQYGPQSTTFKVWAPISPTGVLVLNHQGDTKSYAMQRGKSGVWMVTVEGDLDGASYCYILSVNGQLVQVHDPYAWSSEINSGNSYVINPKKLNKIQRSKCQPPLSQAVIYEMSVRDFSWQKDAKFKHPGKFLGLLESPTYQGEKLGLDYVKALGVTHIQLMPIYDFQTVDEENQALLYNWGYDPIQYNVPEGSYASDPHDPYARICELQDAIGTYQKNGIRVIMDVVYNHVYDVEAFAIEKIVPGYCSRIDENNQRYNGTGVGNDMASERLMMRKFIIDSLKFWTRIYGLDGYRFDLMGILDIETINQAKAAVNRLFPDVIFYGEGWEMAQGIDNRLMAHQFNSYKMPEIGFFNDDYRNSFKAFISFPNSLVEPINRQKVEDLLTGSIGKVLDYARYLNANQTVNYLECHDNATFFDFLRIDNAVIHHTQQKQKARFGLHLLLLSQGAAFIHSGQEFFRTKNNIDNTYNSPDFINQLDWKRACYYEQDVQFIRGLIAFRRAHPILSLGDAEKIKVATSFYWLTNQVLKYELDDGHERLEIIINFSDNNFLYANKENLHLKVQYPLINPDEIIIEEALVIPGQSLIVLSGQPVKKI